MNQNWVPKTSFDTLLEVCNSIIFLKMKIKTLIFYEPKLSIKTSFDIIFTPNKSMIETSRYTYIIRNSEVGLPHVMQAYP